MNAEVATHFARKMEAIRRRRADERLQVTTREVADVALAAEVENPQLSGDNPQSMGDGGNPMEAQTQQGSGVAACSGASPELCEGPEWTQEGMEGSPYPNGDGNGGRLPSPESSESEGGLSKDIQGGRPIM